ncbi:MAG TPA: dienelactone hydrolase family protein [Candidatus Methylacidiphilales bacterium]|jgi:carboxymethylenebutenolidase|nr:dienelactone hydrolase family protein [Candidatus Methylacidiphilales bacterium]
MSSCSTKWWLFAAALVFTGFAHAADAPKPTGRMITLSDFGAEDLGYLAIPASPPSTGIVLVPDAYGLDDFTKSEADRLAAQGYLVLAVDIYNGKQTTDPGDLANLIANLNSDSVMKTVDAGVRFFRESPKFRSDHVVVMGWGTGATYVFQTARDTRTPIDGAITFYGPCPPPDQPLGKFYAPLCAIYSDRDPATTHDIVLSFQQRMKAEGNDCECWFMAAGSGWSEPKSKTYNPGEDREAWKVAVPFLIRIAALPGKKEKQPSMIDKAKDKIENFFQ